LGRTAVVVVDGYSPRTVDAMWDAIRFPWIEVCLREVLRRSGQSDYEIHIWDNAGIREHRAFLATLPGVHVWPNDVAEVAPLPHAVALDELVARIGSDVDYLVTLDTDAFPVADGWIDRLTTAIDQGAMLVGVWRDEMAPELAPFVHPSCLCVRRQDLLDLHIKFSVYDHMEPGQNLTDAVAAHGGQIVPLRRTNKRNPHFLIAGIYGDLVYHHAAGSRPAWFYASDDQQGDERIRVQIRDAVFNDLDHLVAVLRGEVANDIW
jgi:hypothetical protein